MQKAVCAPPVAALRSVAGGQRRSPAPLSGLRVEPGQARLGPHRTWAAPAPPDRRGYGGTDSPQPAGALRRGTKLDLQAPDPDGRLNPGDEPPSSSPPHRRLRRPDPQLRPAPDRRSRPGQSAPQGRGEAAQPPGTPHSRPRCRRCPWRQSPRCPRKISLSEWLRMNPFIDLGTVRYKTKTADRISCWPVPAGTHL